MPPSARSLFTPLADGAPDEGVTEAAEAAAVALSVAVSTLLAMDMPGGRFGRAAGAGAGAGGVTAPVGADFCRLIPGGNLGPVPAPPPLTTGLASSCALCIVIPGGRLGRCC